MKKLAVALAQEGPRSLEKIIFQMNQIVAGTHLSFLFQSSEVKKIQKEGLQQRKLHQNQPKKMLQNLKLSKRSYKRRK